MMDPSRSGICLAQWLKSQDPKEGLYWIGGKPGGGKSTLMKYLYGYVRTQELLNSGQVLRNYLLPDFSSGIRGQKCKSLK